MLMLMEHFNDSSDHFWNSIWSGGVIKDDVCFSSRIVKLIFTVIFPPIGVGIDEREKGYSNVTRIFTCLILTMLFYFPGLIYAMTTNTWK